MKSFFKILAGVFWGACTQVCYAENGYDIIPDLPESLAAAHAASVSTADTTAVLATQSIAHEPSFLSTLFSLVFVVLLIYATGIVYTKLNRFSAKTFKKQVRDGLHSNVVVLSTTQLGNNKSLHVIELDGKRILIGASANSIQLIKDLGSCHSGEIKDGEYSKIEISDIRIPKIEIPKIEIPGFAKIKDKCAADESSDVTVEKCEEVSEEYSDSIIDNLFQTVPQESVVKKQEDIEHKVDPDEFLLYKKYL